MYKKTILSQGSDSKDVISGFILGRVLSWTRLFNFSLDENFLDWTKFKAFSEEKLNVAKIMISVFDRVENIVRKGENAGYQHFLLFPQCFQKVFFSGSLKVGIVW